MCSTRTAPTAPSSPPEGHFREAGVAAFLVRSLPRGGMERVVLAHCLGSRDAGFTPTVLCLEEPGALAAAFRDQGVPVEALQAPAGAAAAALVALPRLVAWLRRVRPAFLQVHMRRAGTLGRLAARRLGIPCLVALHNQDPPAPPWLRPLEAWLDAGSEFLAVSGAVRDHAAAQRGLDPRRVPVLPNPLPGPRPAPRRPPGSPLRVGFLGRLEPKKDPRLFLQAAAHLATRLPGLEVLVAGDGPLRPELEATARTLGVSPRFLGEVDDGPGYLGSLDLACFPSRREGFGLAVGEALSRGAPVLLADIPPFREVYGRLPGACFVPPGAGPEPWTDAMHAVLTDPGLGARIRQAAPTILAAFDATRIRTLHMRYYLERRGLA